MRRWPMYRRGSGLAVEIIRRPTDPASRWGDAIARKKHIKMSQGKGKASWYRLHIRQDQIAIC